MQNEVTTQPGTISTTDVFSNIVISILLCLLTCGIYYLFWNASQMKKLNLLLGKEEFNFWLWFFVSLVTCGIFHIYYQYKMSEAITQIQRNKGRAISESLPLISIILTLVGVSIAIDAIQQHEINKLAA